MKKYIIYFLLCITGMSNAQDQIFKRDNSKVDAKIIEINQNEIKYKLFTYQDGPTIIVAKQEVVLIIYQNGVHEVINASSTSNNTQELPMIIYSNNYNGNVPNRDSIEKEAVKELLSTKNLVSFNMMEPINGSFGLSYIREFANNYLHVYVPITVGFAAPYFTQGINTLFSGNNYSYNNSNSTSISDFRYSNKTYEIGLGIHLQTSGKRAVTHFIGPYVGTSQFTGTYSKSERIFDTNGNYLGYENSNNNFTMSRTYIMLDNGVLFRVNKNFNIMLLAGLGYHIDTYQSVDDPTKAVNYNRNQMPLNAFKFGLSFGYRF